MIDLFGEVVVSDLARVPDESSPMPDTFHMVATWYAPDKHWKMWPERWVKRELADAWAKRLTVRGHTHYVVLEIQLPGISGKAPSDDGA